MFKGIVKSQLLRFRRICTRETDRIEAIKILVKALRGRGYSRHFLRMRNKEEEKGCMGERKAQTANKSVLPFIVEFSKTTKNLAVGLRGNFDRFLKDEALGKQCRVIAAYKREKNLQDMLVQSKMNPANKPSKTHNTLIRGAHRTVHRITQGIPLNRKIAYI